MCGEIGVWLGGLMGRWQHGVFCCSEAKLDR